MISHARLAELSRDVYSAAPTVERGELHAVKTMIDGSAVWSFRGTTADPRCALRDACALPWWDPVLGWCHAGFLDAARILSLDVAFQTEAGTPIVLTGHSLGGAIAMAIGASFAARKHAPAEIVTFNAPRVGSARFCKALSGVPVTMYRFERDPVSCVPWLLGFYRNPVPWTQCHGVKHLDFLLDHASANFIPLN